MREEYAERGPDVILSRRSAAAIVERAGSRGEQVLVLLNRRGFATAVFCRQCGATLECPNCSVSLTVHGERTGSQRARCHYCNYSGVVPACVPSLCGAVPGPHGFGTERVEARDPPGVPGGSRGTARSRHRTVTRRAGCAARAGSPAGEIDVLVGTQMIAKGHDFPRVTLVGVVSADVGLGLADFRAAERTFQLLTQVVGRAGRGERPGEADHPDALPGALQHPARLPPGLRARSSTDEVALSPGDAVPASGRPGQRHRPRPIAGATPWPRRASSSRRTTAAPVRPREFACWARAGAVREAQGREPRPVLPQRAQAFRAARGAGGGARRQPAGAGAG